jgi:hypothetical protein
MAAAPASRLVRQRVPISLPEDRIRNDVSIYADVSLKGLVLGSGLLQQPRGCAAPFNMDAIPQKWNEFARQDDAPVFIL